MRLPRERYQMQKTIETHLPHLSQPQLTGLVPVSSTGQALWVCGAILRESVIARIAGIMASTGPGRSAVTHRDGCSSIDRGPLPARDGFIPGKDWPDLLRIPPARPLAKV